MTRVCMLLLAVMIGGCVGCNDSQPPSEGYLTGSDGADIFYRIEGTGPDTVIVIHGGPGAGMENVRPDLGPLRERHVVIFYDQRGGGRSELPDDSTLLGAEHFIEDLESVRTYFHIGTVNLFAYSFGAIIAAAWTVEHPDRVGKLIFLAATGPAREQAAAFYGRQPAPADTAKARERFDLVRALMSGTVNDPVGACRKFERLGKELGAAQGHFIGWEGSTCDMPAEAVAYQYRYTAQLGAQGFGDWDFTHSFGDLNAPLLVIHGARDTLGLPMSQAWVGAVPKGKLLVVPNAGRVTHAERPEIVFPAIDTFLAGSR